MRNVLVITYDYPPYQFIPAFRYGEMLPYLERHGWRPWVITTHSKGGLRLRLPESQVIRIGKHFHSSLRVEGSGSPRRLEWLRAILRRLHIRFNTFTFQFLQWGWQVRRAQWAIARRLPPIDAVMGTFPRPTVPLLGRHFARFFRVPWLMDFRDLGALYEDDRGALARWLDRQWERWQLRGARATIGVSPTMTQVLQEAYGRRCAVIYNGWMPLDEPPAAMEEADAPAPYLFYPGTLHFFETDAMCPVLDALQRCPWLEWRIRSMGPTERERWIEEAARHRGVGERVHILPAAAADLVDGEAARSFANLVFDTLRTDTLTSRGNLHGKFLRFLPLDAPILAVTRPDSDIGPILAETGKGRLCSTGDQAVEFLECVRRDPSPWRGRPDRVARYSKEVQARKLAQLFDDIVRPSRSLR